MTTRTRNNIKHIARRVFARILRITVIRSDAESCICVRLHAYYSDAGSRAIGRLTRHNSYIKGARSLLGADRILIGGGPLLIILAHTNISLAPMSMIHFSTHYEIQKDISAANIVVVDREDVARFAR